jgi:hypothetical protein
MYKHKLIFPSLALLLSTSASAFDLDWQKIIQTGGETLQKVRKANEPVS